jgi:hypothetical protein
MAFSMANQFKHDSINGKSRVSEARGAILQECRVHPEIATTRRGNKLGLALGSSHGRSRINSRGSTLGFESISSGISDL